MALVVSGRAFVLRAVATVTVASVTLLLAAAPAHAVVTAEIEFGDTLTITTTAVEDNVSVSCVADEVYVVDSTPPLAPFACAGVGYIDVFADEGVGGVNLGGVTQLAFPALNETSVHVEDGLANSVTGSEARDVVRADSADDVSSGLGNDWVDGAGSASGGEGDDTLRDISLSARGGSGDDLIVGAPAVLIDGGSGFDTVVTDYSTFSSQTTVILAITDASINGATETTSIEAYDVTSSDGVKADSVDSRGFSGRVTLHGRAGDDTFLGGPGADVADLGPGHDVVDPGPGSDLVLAGDGDDTIQVRDGFGDVVECGPGTDTVTADRVDILSGCENVALPAPETSRIDGPKRITKGTKAFFTFASSVVAATFECRIDAGAFKPCASPFKVKSRKLKVGKHTLQVRSVHPVANADPTPSSFRFKVKPKPTAHV